MIITQIMGINAQTLAETDDTTADYFVITDIACDAYGNYVDHTPRSAIYPTYESAKEALHAPYIFAMLVDIGTDVHDICPRGSKECVAAVINGTHVRVEDAEDLNGNGLPGYLLTVVGDPDTTEYVHTATGLKERLRSLY